MPKLVSTDDLKDALNTFRERGDERWALKADVTTAVSEAIGEMSGLTDEDVEEVLEAAEDPP